MPILSPGDKAPSFKAQNQDGETVKLSDFKGKKLVLYFYPTDDTPTCTVEACNLRDNYADLRAQGYEVIGISTDTVKSHLKFVNKYQLPFTLIADVDQKIVNDYGVWGEKTLFGHKYMGIKRTTFLIDKKGVIERIIEKVTSKNHTAQILKTK
jgi:peroxiredoxin Q/BCP